MPLIDLATKKITIVQGSSPNDHGSIELAIWHKDDTMTVHICQCKGLSGRPSGVHTYVQTYMLGDENSRKLTEIISGKKFPIFDTKLFVSFLKMTHNSLKLSEKVWLTITSWKV